MFSLLLQIPTFVAALVAILREAPVVIELLKDIFNAVHQVKQALPEQKVSLVNVVQQSANHTLDNSRTVLPGYVLPVIPTPSLPDDPRLQKVIQDNTVTLASPGTGKQEHVSLIDGQKTFTEG